MTLGIRRQTLIHSESIQLGSINSFRRDQYTIQFISAQRGWLGGEGAYMFSNESSLFDVEVSEVDYRLHSLLNSEEEGQ